MLALNDGQDVTRRLLERFCIYSRLSTYTMLENVDIDWFWKKEEVREFDKTIRAGLGIKQIADKFKRTQEEVVLLMIDRQLRDTVSNCEPSYDGFYRMLESVEINWFWDMRDVVMFDIYHKSGISLQTISKTFNRPLYEVMIMTIDRALQDKIGGVAV